MSNNTMSNTTSISISTTRQMITSLAYHSSRECIFLSEDDGLEIEGLEDESLGLSVSFIVVVGGLTSLEPKY